MSCLTDLSVLPDGIDDGTFVIGLQLFSKVCDDGRIVVDMKGLSDWLDQFIEKKE